MIPVIQWPTVETLGEVINAVPYNPNYVASRLLPDLNAYTNYVRWEIKGPATGMTQAHSLNSDPKLVTFPTLATKTQPTTFWKEASVLNESDFLEIRKAGTLSERMGRELITTMLLKLNQRADTRLEWLKWQALMGTVTINENGVIRTIDYEIPGTHIVGPPSTGWATIATATPLADMSTWAVLFEGTGCGMPTAYMNKTTARYLAQNHEIRDLVKQSTNVVNIGMNNIVSLFLQLSGDIKDIVVYDEGYITDGGVWTKFIPDNKVILIGEPAAGEPFGNFVFTPSLHNGGIDNPTPGKFVITEDNTGKANPSYMVAEGFYGLPVIYHPSWIVVATVQS